MGKKNLVHGYKGTLSRTVRERVALEGAGDGFTTRPRYREDCAVQLLVDWDLLLRILGERAMVSHRGTATSHAGALVAIVRNRANRLLTEE